MQHPFFTYADTKLCNVLYTVHAQKLLEQQNLSDRLAVVSFSPGTVPTNGSMQTNKLIN